MVREDQSIGCPPQVILEASSKLLSHKQEKFLFSETNNVEERLEDPASDELEIRIEYPFKEVSPYRVKILSAEG